MKRCDECRGTGLLNLGGLYDGHCPNCKGSGWVDDKIQGPPPKKKKETPAPADRPKRIRRKP